ncbi:hypothetical protein L9G16_22350, partial [Shewanella sp. A25]|nr:hypothetical protein [Shewanella shenzhenensis]
FIEALQQPDEKKRSAFMDEACGHDPKLRKRVEALLRQEEGLNSFLEQPAYELNETPHSPDVPKGVGTVIGPYKLMEQIGEGGFG